jgi:hypothetical protein
VLDIVSAKIEATLRMAVWGVAAAVSGVVGLLFLLIALFMWLADRYGPLTACTILGLVFMVLALGAVLALALTRRQSEVRARQQRARAATAWWLDPRILAGGLEAVRLLGSRRTTLLLLAAVASGFLLSSVRPSEAADPPEP